MERQQVFYSGRVQGVGFRYTATSLARQFAVTGIVKNLTDGRVQLVAEGDTQEVEAFLHALAERMGDNIRQTELSRSPATGQWSSFQTEF